MPSTAAILSGHFDTFGTTRLYLVQSDLCASLSVLRGTLPNGANLIPTIYDFR